MIHFNFVCFSPRPILSLHKPKFSVYVILLPSEELSKWQIAPIFISLTKCLFLKDHFTGIEFHAGKF